MPTRTLLNLVLAAAAVALGLVIYFQPGLEPGAVPQPLTTDLDVDSATSIRIERIRRDPLAFVRHGERWFLQNGDRELPASEFQVRSLLRLLEATTIVSYPLDTLDSAALGLEPPQATVTIDAVEFRLGTTESLENRRYILVEDTVYLLEDQYQHLINADWSNFVSRRLLPAGSTITGLELPDTGLVLSTDGKWEMTPADPAISADAIQLLIDNWVHASALYVRRFDGNASGETIVLRTRENPNGIRLRIVARTPEFILARPDWHIQYHLASDIGADLLRVGDMEEMEETEEPQEPPATP
jgi:hypothetical protein